MFELCPFLKAFFSLFFLQIVFEAIRGSSLRSDIAVDDIVFQAGPCEGAHDAYGLVYSEPRQV